MNLVVVLLLVSLFFSGFSMVVANVLLIGSNITVSFNDMDANFSPLIKGSGFSGVLYVADPLDACSVLTNKVEQATNASSPVLLIIRGECSFEDKVRRAQKAGFKAAIVYDNKDGDSLISMAGNSRGIKIHALFVSKATGEELMKYTGNTDLELWLTPSFVNAAGSVMAISFISLLAMFAMLATCLFVRRHRIRREQPRASRVREFRGMSNCLVKAMPSLIFTAVFEDNCTSRTCAICLEDYSVGEKLRILPCFHKFHAFCVDSWLTSWRTFCPVCKRDARTSTGDAPASESTPLLSYSSVGSIASSSMLSSVRSSLASSAMHMALASYQSASVSSTSNLQQSFRSYGQTPPLSINRSSIDLQNASSQRSRAPYLVSAHSSGYPSLSSLNLRYLSPYIPSPSNASSIYLSSSSYQQHPLRCSESTTSFSPFNSSLSLPDC